MKLFLSLCVVVIVTIIGVFYFFKHNNTTKDMNMTKKVKIIAVGDSLTAGYGVGENENYPSLLQQKLKSNGYLNAEVVNLGINGETSVDLLERIDSIKDQKSDAVIITTGGNDLLRRLPVENTKENITKIIQSLKQNISGNNIFLIQTEAPPGINIGNISKYSDIYKEVADSEKIKLIPVSTLEIFLKGNLMQRDNIHPNKQGYQYLIDNYIYKEIIEVFQ